MALSSEPWIPAVPPSRGCGTVLMSVRVSVCHSGLRPLCLPSSGDESLRLQLSMDPARPGHFSLCLRDASGPGPSVSVAEFDLRSVRYEVKSARCHELQLLSPPRERLTFSFRSEKEAQEWATVVTSSLREAHRVADGSPPPEGQTQGRTGDQGCVSLPLTEELCGELVRVIQAGDAHAASRCAVSLANQQVALKIQLSEKSYTDVEINLAVVVEDASSSCSVTVKVSPHMTVAALKQQVFEEYGFHPRVQRWVMGRCLCAEPRSLASYGVRRDGDTAFLYLLSARQARVTRQLCQQEQESALVAPAPAVQSNKPTAHDWRGYSTLPCRLSHSSSGNTSVAAEMRDLLNLEVLQLSDTTRYSKNSTQAGWSCPSCTFINKPTRPGCEICSAERPESYGPAAQQDKDGRENLPGCGSHNNQLLVDLPAPHNHNY